MNIIIKTGDQYCNKIKYVVVNKKKKKCLIIPANKESKLQDIRLNLEETLEDYDFNLLPPLTVKEELEFVWPQIIQEARGRFPYIAKWMERAEVKLVDKNKKLDIGFETKIAYKKADNPQFKNFLKNRIEYYMEVDLKLDLHNGNFLDDIDPDQISREEINGLDNIGDPPPRKGGNMDYSNSNNKKSSQNGQNKSNSNSKPQSKRKQKHNKILHGRKVAQDITHNLAEIQTEGRRIVAKGEVFNVDTHTTRTGKTLYIISITDKSNSITAKLFLDKNKELNGSLSEKDWVKVRGRIQFDRYSKELTLMIEDLMKIEPEIKQDNSPEKRVELHLHTQMSAMDSVVNVEEIIEKAADWGHEAIAITDHGVVQAFPEAYQAGQEHGVKIMYGMEAYMVDDGEPIVITPPDKRIADVEFTVFDLETTGLSPKKNEIIEIGAVKVKDGEIIDRFNTFVKPSSPIPNKITELTGIDDGMVTDAPLIEEALEDFIEFFSDSILVAHNADFDYSFLNSSMNRTDKEPLDNSVLDTLALSRALLPELKNHKLNTIADYYNVSLENHHRAVDDAEATAEVFLEFIEEIEQQGYEMVEEINRLTSRISWKELPTYHTIILAKNNRGLKKLYELVSKSHQDYFYRKPRVLKSILAQYKDDLIIGSACEAGQLFRAFLQDKNYSEIKKIASFYDYLEIQPVGNNNFLIPDRLESKEEIKEINKEIYKLGKNMNKPVVATCDVHFANSEDRIFREILQTGQKFDDADQQPPLYYRTTEEMLEEFKYLGEGTAREVVIDNPKKIATKTEELKPIPDGLFTPEIEGATEQVKEMTYGKAQEMYGDDLPDIVESRLEKELNAIIDNGYSVIYLISHKLVKKSLEDGYLVGSRGSVGSSLVATMCEITEVNPLPPHYRCPECNKNEFVDEKEIGVGVDLSDKECPDCGTDYIKDGYDIPFEVFMGFKGDKVPDIDLNFSGEYQNKIHRETEKLFGEDYVFRAGTISTIADRTAFGFVKGYMDDNDVDLRKAEVNRLVSGCTGVRRTTGQHPGGLMVVPRNKDIHDFSPIQHPANDQETDVRTTHFDYHSISGRILKLDLLGHDDPTSIRMLQDLTGVKPEDIPLDDPDTMSLFSSTSALDVSSDELGVKVGSLGIPEFGTSFVRQMLVDTEPTTFAELVRISGLSHGSDVWLNNAQDLIKEGKAVLSEVISVRDDIMNYLLQKGLEPSMAFWIMEHVRKGKGLTTEEEKAMRDAGVPDWYIKSCKKIKYMFPKAHAAAYVMMAYRIAYFKVHYPEAFYQTYFTIKAGDFDALMVGKGFDYIKQKRKELEDKGNDMTAKEKGTLTVLQIVMEAMLRGVDFTKVDLYRSPAYSFDHTEDGLLPPLISLQGLGSSAAESIAATREEREFKSIEDLVNRTSVTKTVVEVLKEHGSLAGLPEKNQLSLF